MLSPVRARGMQAILLSAAAFLLVSPYQAQANVGEAFGFGSQSAALAGAGAAAADFGAFSTYGNPATLSVEKSKRLTISWGLLFAEPSFTPIDNVLVSNNVTAGSDLTGSIDQDYKSTFGQMIALSYRLFPETLNLTFGAITYFPIDDLAYMDTGPTLQPEYVLYRARTQRPQFEFGIGADLGSGFHAGVGMHLAYSLTTNADVTIATTNGTSSSMRLTSSLKPRAAPSFGLSYVPPVSNPAFSLGAVVRLPVSSANNITVKNTTRVVGTNLDFNFGGFSAIYYDPLSVELGAVIQEGDVGKLYLQGEFQAWGSFEPPGVNINQTAISSCGPGCPIAINPSTNPAYRFRDIFVPRVGQEFELGRSTIRLGYAYRPSILSELPTGNGNYLDPPKHIITAGFGYKFAHFLSFDVPCTLDLHGTYQALVSQHIDKVPGTNELGNSGDEKIGYPGYDAGGSVYGGGASITLAI